MKTQTSISARYLRGEIEVGGRERIRTSGRIAPTPDFESGAFNHSATLPAVLLERVLPGLLPAASPFDEAWSGKLEGRDTRTAASTWVAVVAHEHFQKKRAGKTLELEQRTGRRIMNVNLLDGVRHHMKAPIQLETTRLILRQPMTSDAVEIFERYASNAEVTRFLGWPRHQSLQDTEAFVRFSTQEWDNWPAGPYLIVSRTDGRLLGGTGLGFQTPHEAMTGYVLAKDAWGKGFATEALAAIVNLAPRVGVTRLFALCHPEHLPSRHVLEKCGFVRDDASKPAVEFPNLSPGVRQEALHYALSLSAEANQAS